MTDNLRDRIAAVVDDFYIYDPCWHPDDWKVAVANTVIEALGLEVTVTAKASDGRFRSFSIEGYWEERVTDDR